VDGLGQIWVSYFDEGLFGNYGWRTPIGRSGLCCFTNSGQRIWEYESPSGFDGICDCYALNVSRDGVWAYYYSEVPIVRVGPDWNVQGWHTQRPGCRALAIRDNRALLYGRYGERRTTCQLLELTASDTKPVAEIALDLHSETDLSNAIVIGRDMELHVFAGDDWYRFSLESLT